MTGILRGIGRMAIICLLSVALLCSSAASAAAFRTLASPLTPSFVEEVAQGPIWFNGNRVAPTGLEASDNYKWVPLDDGGSCLMVLVDASDGTYGKNENLLSTEFEEAYAEMRGGNILVEWAEMYEPDVGVILSFQNKSDVMQVKKNSLTGKTGEVKLAAKVFRDESRPDCYYLPLYAILNEIGGGLSQGIPGIEGSFIYSGANRQYPDIVGQWEMSDSGAEYQEVAADGETRRVGYPWMFLQLLPGSMFVELHCDYQDGDWIFVRREGRFSVAGNLLVMKCLNETEYLGRDFDNLPLVKSRAPQDDRNAENSVYSYYVWSWDEDLLILHGMHYLYAYTGAANEAFSHPGLEGD